MSAPDPTAPVSFRAVIDRVAGYADVARAFGWNPDAGREMTADEIAEHRRASEEGAR